MNADVEKAKKELLTELTKIGSAVAIQVFNAVVVGTPVDTGRARGNWQIGLGSIPSGVSDGVTNPLDASTGMTNWSIKDTAYLTNNLDYIESLEYNHGSKQQANGWVRATVAQGQKALNEAVEKVGDK